jgi:hypothetical protein
MITIVPSDAIILDLGGFASRPYPSVDWWRAYAWFAERLCAWRPQDIKREILDATSGINCHAFDPLRRVEEPVHRLAYLFKHVGVAGLNDAHFLAHLQRRRWADLAQPIVIPGRRPKDFPRREWFEMKGRTFRQSPNKYHPKATCVQGFGLQLCERKGWLQWVGLINYGYPHEGSSWSVEIPQLRNESLDRFAGRIQKTIGGLLVPDEFPHGRQRREEDWERTHRALRDLFCTDVRFGDDNQLTARMMESRVNLNKERLMALKQWIAADRRRGRKAERQRERK